MQKKIRAATQKATSQEDKKLSERLVLKIGLLASLLVVCTAVLVVHWPVLSAQAKFLDDSQYLTDNLLVQNPGWASVWRLLTEVLEPSTVSGYYQPLAMLSLMADCALGGHYDNLLPFHRTSLALHMANTALVIVLLYSLFGRVWIAAGVGLLFGLHPMTVEPIAWISDRKTLLATFFALWCLILYVRFTHKSDWRFYVGCIIMYVLALMSKPTSLPLPVLMLLMDYWPLRRLKRWAVAEKLPLFVIGAISASITYISQSRAAPIMLGGGYGLQRMPLIFCHNIIFYLSKIVWPTNLSPYYAFPEPLGLSDSMVLIGVIGTCILIPLLVISLRWIRALLMGWLFFFVAILPTMQVLRFSDVIAADKFAYLASLGLLMVLAMFLSWFCCTGSFSKAAARRIVVVIIVLILAGAEAVATRRYLVHWRDRMSLYEHILTVPPDAPVVCNNMAWILATHPDPKIRDANRAIRLAKRAVELAKYQKEMFIDTLAAAYAANGQFDQATKTAQEALALAFVAKNEELTDCIRTRLELYRQGKPYLEPASP